MDWTFSQQVFIDAYYIGDMVGDIRYSSEWKRHTQFLLFNHFEPQFPYLKNGNNCIALHHSVVLRIKRANCDKEFSNMLVT